MYGGYIASARKLIVTKHYSYMDAYIWYAVQTVAYKTRQATFLQSVQLALLCHDVFSVLHTVRDCIWRTPVPTQKYPVTLKETEAGSGGLTFGLFPKDLLFPPLLSKPPMPLFPRHGKTTHFTVLLFDIPFLLNYLFFKCIFLSFFYSESM